MEAFRNIAEFEQWLIGQPAGFARVIAARAALMALPAVVRSRRSSFFQSVSMAVWRANAIAWIASFGSDRADALKAAARAAGNAAADAAGFTAASVAINAAYAASAAAWATAVDAFATRAVESAARSFTYADEAAAAAALAAEDAAAFAYKITNRSDTAVEAAIYDAATDAHRADAVANAARTLATANAAARTAAAVMWEHLSDVASALENGEDQGEVGRSALPLGLADDWSGLSSALLKESTSWSVWICWYEDRLAGRPPDSTFERALLSITAAEWKLEPAAVNTLLTAQIR